MSLKKCRYYNNHQTAFCMMLDDLIPAAVSHNGIFGPHNDWGFFQDEVHSLFSYFNRYILEKFPEIRGTIFLPLKAQDSICLENGYHVLKKDLDDEFIGFIHRGFHQFECAFHGIKHTLPDNEKSFFEFEILSHNDFHLMKTELEAYARRGLEFSGGKFPGYRFNQLALDFIQYMDFKWFSLEVEMINRKHKKNKLGYIKNTKIVSIPTNISGNIFNISPMHTGIVKRVAKRLLFPERFVKPEAYLEYLYLNGFPITVQEHFQNQSTKGKRQTPNVYDDINSLQRILGMVRPWDIWYASCSDLAHYFDSFEKTQIIENMNGSFNIQYSGNWDDLLLSFTSNSKFLKDLNSKEIIHGLLRKGKYVFNDLHSGKSYKCL